MSAAFKTSMPQAASMMVFTSPDDLAGLIAEKLNDRLSGPAMPFPPFLTRRQAAHILGVDQKTVGRYIQAGKLRCGRPGAAECISAEDLMVLYAEKRLL